MTETPEQRAARLRSELALHRAYLKHYHEQEASFGGRAQERMETIYAIRRELGE